MSLSIEDILNHDMPFPVIIVDDKDFLIYIKLRKSKKVIFEKF